MRTVPKADALGYWQAAATTLVCRVAAAGDRFAHFIVIYPTSLVQSPGRDSISCHWEIVATLHTAPVPTLVLPYRPTSRYASTSQSFMACYTAGFADVASLLCSSSLWSPCRINLLRSAPPFGFNPVRLPPVGPTSSTDTCFVSSTLISNGEGKTHVAVSRYSIEESP